MANLKKLNKKEIFSNNNNETNKKIVEKYLLKENINFKKLKIIKGGYSNNLNATFFINNSQKIIKIFSNKKFVKREFKNIINYFPGAIMGKNYLIRDFVVSSIPKKLNKKQTLSLIDSVDNLHSSKPIVKNKFGYDAYDSFYRNDTKYIAAKKLLKSQKQVNIHGDINKKNILIKNNEVTLIDFEWASSGSKLIDYAYIRIFFPETKKYLEVENIDKAMYFIKLHTIGWCKKENTEKSKKLLNKLILDKN